MEMIDDLKLYDDNVVPKKLKKQNGKCQWHAKPVQH